MGGGLLLNGGVGFDPSANYGKISMSPEGAVFFHEIGFHLQVPQGKHFQIFKSNIWEYIY